MDDKEVGFVMLHRKFKDNFLWREKRVFSRAEAWVDILMEVRWGKDPDSALIDGRLIECTYAQSLNSMDTWAERWGWHRSKVRRFLKLLERDEMIEVDSPLMKTTRITVCNYKRYHSRRTGDEQETNSTRIGGEHEANTEEEEKEYKEEEEEKEKERIEEVKLQNDIGEILTLFETKVKGRRNDKSGTLKTKKKAIETLLKAGTPKETLLLSVTNYSEDINDTEPKFRKGAQTFFGPKYSAWRDYAKEDWRGPEGPTERLTPTQRLARDEAASGKFDGLD